MILSLTLFPRAANFQEPVHLKRPALGLLCVMTMTKTLLTSFSLLNATTWSWRMQANLSTLWLATFTHWLPFLPRSMPLCPRLRPISSQKISYLQKNQLNSSNKLKVPTPSQEKCSQAAKAPSLSIRTTRLLHKTMISKSMTNPRIVRYNRYSA